MRAEIQKHRIVIIFLLCCIVMLGAVIKQTRTDNADLRREASIAIRTLNERCNVLQAHINTINQRPTVPESVLPLPHQEPNGDFGPF